MTDELSTPTNLLGAALPTPLKMPLKRPNLKKPEENTTSIDIQTVRLLIEQSPAEFAYSCLEEIEQLQFPIDSAETYRNLFSSLKETRQVQVTWSDSSE